LADPGCRFPSEVLVSIIAIVFIVLAVFGVLKSLLDPPAKEASTIRAEGKIRTINANLPERRQREKRESERRMREQIERLKVEYDAEDEQ
jgi:hypothetical protein